MLGKQEVAPSGSQGAASSNQAHRLDKGKTQAPHATEESPRKATQDKTYAWSAAEIHLGLPLGGEARSAAWLGACSRMEPCLPSPHHC